MLLEARHIKKSYGDRVILAVENIRIYSQDRIGIVGRNGVGKTTLLSILAGQLKPDEGSVKYWGTCAYIKQFNEGMASEIHPAQARKYSINADLRPTMSEGEKNRYQIASALSQTSQILFADEPTSNLDLKGIQILEAELEKYPGAVIIISHDRSLLDKVCNKIWQLEEGKISVYTGNYSAYLQQKDAEHSYQILEYQKYVTEKARLQLAIQETRERAREKDKPPKGMTSSEAREVKVYYATKQKKVQNAGKSLETRLNKLEAVERPRELPRAKIDIPAHNRLYSQIIISAEELHKAFASRLLFHNGKFQIANGQKVALIGDNGSGKTTLLRMIINRDKAIYVAAGVKFGYFDQRLDILNPEQTILENVMESSAHPQLMVRTILARLLFREDEVYKKVKVLSGGEKVRAAFAKVFLSDINVLVMDEPTNYLDIETLEALEQLLQDYQGTLLLVSHDRYFVSQVTDNTILIADQTLTFFSGTYAEYQERLPKDAASDLKDRLLLLETRLSDVISKLSLSSPNENQKQLDLEYKALLGEIKELRARIQS